jgi:hypothetical protein
MIRAAVWTLLGAAVVLATRTIVYALAPSQSQLLVSLEQKTGQPDVTGALVGVAVLAGTLGIVALWLSVVAVRERFALERHDLVDAPRIRPWLLAARALALFVAASFVFAMLESYLHWRAGLGWHGLHCLIGPEHRDAIPVVAGLSLFAAAAHGAFEHLLAWVHRLVALFAARLPVLRGATPIFSSTARPRSARVGSAAAPRGPPAGARAVER